MIATHIKTIGGLLLVLALIHIFFPKYFNWKKDLATLSLINRQMMTVHTFFIAFVVFLMGLLCVTSAEALTATDLGRKICLGLGIFWGMRWIFQLFVYSPKLWQGKLFETTIHMLFTLLWLYLTAVFFAAAFQWT